MRDYYYNHDGMRLAVSQMPIEVIHACLDDGIAVLSNDFEVEDPYHAVMLRLEIELVRRRLGIPCRVAEHD